MNVTNLYSIAFFGDSLTEGIPGVSYFNLLKEKMPDPEYVLKNYGKGGDTVKSLYRRIRKLNIVTLFDISFLWVGTNDIFVKVSGAFPIIKTILKQPWARTTDEFGRYYQLLLKHLTRISAKVVTVPPLFLGEDLNNTWNRDLARLSEVIRKQSAGYENVSYLDLRDFFPVKPTPGRKGYVARRAGRVILDAAIPVNKEKVDRKSAKRGLHYTLDGVHLNSRGAQIVTDVFYKQITDILKIWRKL